MTTSLPHQWLDPTTLAARLGATKHGDTWRACCPAHEGDNPTSLAIKEGRDKHGLPMTLMHCFAHGCPIEDICAALDIPLASLFLTHPSYSETIRRQPRHHSQRLTRLAAQSTPATQEDIAELLLCEMIESDPPFIHECEEARQTLRRLCQEPERRVRIFQALHRGGIPAREFFATIRAVESCQDGH